MIKYNISLNQEELLSIVNQLDIYKLYSGGRITGEGMYYSILRTNKEDTLPSLSVYQDGNLLLWKDWGTNEGGNAITFVMKKLYLSFEEAVNRIYKDMQLNRRVVIHTPKSNRIPTRKPTESIIIPTIRKWNISDKHYWTQYNIDKSVLEDFRVYPINEFYMKYSKGSFKKTYYGTQAYCYYNGRINGIERFQIYVPNKRGQGKWYTNLPYNTVHGWFIYPEKRYNYLIITKSLKDVIVLYKANIPAIAPPSEGTLVRHRIMEYYFNNVSTIYTLYDFDYKGIVSACGMRREYNTIPLFLTNGKFGTIDYGSKDVSDYVKDNSFEDLNKLINNVKKQQNSRT